MADSNKPKRAYNSTRRQEQARQTQQQIAAAARKLFTQRGYAGATIESIAQEAGVSPETIYSVFGSKRKILAHLLDISVGGDNAPIGVLERPEPQAILQLKDQQQQIRMMSQGIAAIMERAAPVFEIMRIAAKTEPDIDSMLEHILKERHQNMGLVIERIVANGALREGLTNAKAADVLWTLTSAEVFLLLTVDRSWSRDQYIDWLVDSLIRLLLP